MTAPLDEVAPLSLAQDFAPVAHHDLGLEHLVPQRIWGRWRNHRRQILVRPAHDAQCGEGWDPEPGRPVRPTQPKT